MGQAMPKSAKRIGLSGRVIMSLLLLAMIPLLTAGYVWLHVRAPYLYPFGIVAGAAMVGGSWALRGQWLAGGDMLLVALPAAILLALMSLPIMAAMFREGGSPIAFAVVALAFFLSGYLLLLTGLWLAHVLARALGRMKKSGT